MGDDFYIYNSYRSDGVLARETERHYSTRGLEEGQHASSREV